MRNMKAVSMIVAGLALGSNVLSAQSASANIQATATVLTQLTAAAGANLLFGNVAPGVPKAIAATGVGAGRFDVTAQASTPVLVSFGLPATLAGPAASTMPIATWTGYYNTTNSQAGGAAFTPSASNQAATTSASGALFVFVGATVSPAAAQTSGAYTGTVTMTVIY